jgi:type IX secretion system substrate protein
MKKIYVILILIASLPISAQPYIDWYKLLGSVGIDQMYCIRNTTDSAYIVVGKSDVAFDNGDVAGGHGLDDFWVVKLDLSGNIIWQDTFGGSGWDYAADVAVLADGGYAITGSTTSVNGQVTGNHSQNYDIWVVRLDASGNLLWQKTYGGVNGDTASKIKQTPDGGFVIAGTAESNDGDFMDNHSGGATSDGVLVKIDSLGNLQWEKCYGGSLSDSLYTIELTPDGGYILAGYSSSTNGDLTQNAGVYDYMLIKTDSVGSIEWVKTWGGPELEGLVNILVDDDGNYIVTGFSYADHKGMVAKVGINGTIIWQCSLPYPYVQSNHPMVKRPEGGYFVLSSKNQNFCLYGLTADGLVFLERTFGGTVLDYPLGMTYSPTGDIITCGYTAGGGLTGFHYGGNDALIVQYAAAYLGINEAEEILFSMYPNPVSDELHFTLPLHGAIRITDLQGKIIISDTQAQSVDVSTLSAGVYIAEISYQKTVIRKKFVKN